MTILKGKAFILGVLLTLLLSALPQVWAQGRSAKIDPAFTAFWIKFKSAVARNDKNAVADMTKLPFWLAGKDRDRAEFIKRYTSLFTPQVRRCVAREKPGIDGDIYEIFCGDEIYIFAKVDGVYKFTEIGAND
jgi:hypothetical protein